MKKIFYILMALLVSNSALALPKGQGDAGVGTGKVKRTGYVNAPEGSPTRAILNMEDKMKGYKTQKPLSAADQTFNSNLKKQIIQTGFDLPELCKRSLDAHWATLNATQQSEFVRLMERILERKALFANEQSKTKGRKYVVNYLGDTFAAATALSKIRIQTQDNNEINIQYKFRKTGTEWRIFDVVVDDASLVENYRYQFDSIIKKHGYPELVNRMNKKIQEE